MAFLFFLLGLIIIIKGGDLFVDSASVIGTKTGVPRFIIGATIVSLATTLPELMVSLLAINKGALNLGIGNAIGSVSCNIGIALSLTLLFAKPNLKFNQKDLGIKTFIMLASAIILWLFVGDLRLAPFESLSLLAVLLLYIYINLAQGKREHKKSHKPLDIGDIFPDIIKFVLGAVAIALGAHILVENATIIAKSIGISQRVIGLTLVAVGTSLPEIVTSITAIAKNESSMSIGNIIGANIIDLTLILPLCSIFSKTGLLVSQQTFKTDLPVTIGLAILMVVPSFFGGFKKWQGYTLFLLYICYSLTMFF